jgi:hypothetical protein
MKNEIVKLEKIGLSHLLEVLTEMHDRGADYIDIEVDMNVGADSMSIIVKKEYITDDESGRGLDDDKDVEEEESPKNEDIILNENDLYDYL